MRQLNQQIFFWEEKENREKSSSGRTPMNKYVILVARTDGNFWQLLVDLDQIFCAFLCYQQ
jgi:hypothetical protein